MSRRLSTYHIRAAPFSITRPAHRYFTFLNMEEDHSLTTATTDAANVPISSRTTVTHTPDVTKSSSPSTIAKSIPLPRTPVTPTDTSRLWNPSRGIIFAPSPVTPWSPSARAFATKSRSPIDSPGNDIESGPSSETTPKRRGRKKKSLPADDERIAGAASKTIFEEAPKAEADGDPRVAFTSTSDPDGVAANSSTFQDDASFGEESDIDSADESDYGETYMTKDEEAMMGHLLEDPGIERVKTPEGVEIIMWKKKPLVYTDEKDPYMTLEYQVDQDDLQKAINENKSFSFEAYVNGEKIPPTIHYVSDIEEMERVAKLFDGDKAIGFDMEWTPNRVLKPVSKGGDVRILSSVIQIANAERIAIFHLSKFPLNTKSFISPTLKKIIEDPKVLKTGVWIKADMQRLATVIDISPAGALELAEFHSLIFAAQKNNLLKGERLPGSLTDLSKRYLKLPLEKGDVRVSNWALTLDHQQKIYAANDAYASFRIFDAMDEVRRSLDPRPALPPAYSRDHKAVVEQCLTRLSTKAAAEALTELSLSPKKKTAIRVPKDASPELEKAYEWVKEYAKTVPDEVLKATVADLRCYALWKNQDMDVSQVASACRDPPLVEGYVATKILEAIRLEELPYSPHRLADVISEVPKEVMRSGRYTRLKIETYSKIREMRMKRFTEIEQGTVYSRLLEDSRRSLEILEPQTKVTTPPKIRFKPHEGEPERQIELKIRKVFAYGSESNKTEKQTITGESDANSTDTSNAQVSRSHDSSRPEDMRPRIKFLTVKEKQTITQAGPPGDKGPGKQNRSPISADSTDPAGSKMKIIFDSDASSFRIRRVTRSIG